MTVTAADMTPEQRRQAEIDAEWRAIYGRLSEAAELGYPPAWIPEKEGDEVIGCVVDFKPRVATSYGPVPVVTLKQPDGQPISVWLTHTVLRRAFAREGVALGETVLVRYAGARDGGPTGSYHDYRVVVDRPKPSGQIDWHTVSVEHEDDVEELARNVPPPDVPPTADGEDIPF